MKQDHVLVGGMTCFSRITPGTHIVSHTGPSNLRYCVRAYIARLHSIVTSWFATKVDVPSWFGGLLGRAIARRQSGD
jgi:hypothetical protein